jgi:hypothetical protein
MFCSMAFLTILTIFLFFATEPSRLRRPKIRRPDISDALLPNISISDKRSHRRYPRASTVLYVGLIILNNFFLLQIQTAKAAYAENTTYERFAKYQLKTFAEMDALLKASVAKGTQTKAEQAS